MSDSNCLEFSVVKDKLSTTNEFFLPNQKFNLPSGFSSGSGFSIIALILVIGHFLAVENQDHVTRKMGIHLP